MNKLLTSIGVICGISIVAGALVVNSTPMYIVGFATSFCFAFILIVLLNKNPYDHV